MHVFEQLRLWMDAVPRSGPEAMAVDDWLLETTQLPVLRVYRWAGEWASLGYFGAIGAARDSFPGVGLVRRWTGGGLVDHRADWTYSVVAPATEALARWRGAESYRRIHAALAATLAAEGISARLSRGVEVTDAALCFENPVHHDLLGADGRKLAGAGQRRTRLGLLHQGSAVGLCPHEGRAEAFAGQLARSWIAELPCLRLADLAPRMAARYARDGWNQRR